MVIALVGRRIDAPGAGSRRFPLSSVPRVTARLGELFEREGARVLVCSAACGADLVALAVAGALGMERRVVLPSSPERFRATSVTDRPGDWGAVYDRVLAELAPRGAVVAVEGVGAGKQGFLATNEAILDRAVELAREADDDALAVLVWEGKTREGEDVTAAFGDAAGRRGLRVVEIATV
jgi:hypothetical protein